jgi:acyl-coenzyme A synthetase/AMP-(fatty) acid ligase
MDYPDVYCLTDAERTDGPAIFRYPSSLPHDPAHLVLRFPADQLAAVLFTSGSTGRPQPHGRSWGDLVNSTLAAGRRLGIGSLQGASLIGTVPHQHSYGLESLPMLALQHGLVLYSGRPFYPADIVAELAAAPHPRVLVTTPLHLQVLLAEPVAMPSVDLVLSATAPLSVQLAREAEQRFAGTLYEIYGCSEAGQIAVRRTALTQEWCYMGFRCSDRGRDFALRRHRTTRSRAVLIARPHCRSGQRCRQAHVAGAPEPSSECDRGGPRRRICCLR